MLTLLFAALTLSSPAHASKKDDERFLSAVSQIEADRGSQTPAAVQAELEALLGTYQPKSKVQGDALEKALRESAVAYHTEARKLRSGPEAVERSAVAEALYRDYMATFPNAPAAYDMHYAFGELLYGLKKFDEAYFEYVKVADLDPAGAHTKFCVESAIFAAQEMQKTEQHPPGELSTWDMRALIVMDRYAELYPEDPKVQKILYQSAYLTYNRGLYADATPRFTRVIAMNPGSKEAEMAANLVLDSLVTSGDFRALRDTALTFIQMEGLGSPAFQSELQGIYVAASCKIGEPLPGSQCP